MSTFDRKNLLEMYYVKEMTIQSMAEQCKCSYENIFYHLFKSNTPVKKRNRTLTIDEIAEIKRIFEEESHGESYEEDLTTIVLSAQVGISKVRKMVRNLWIRRFGPTQKKTMQEQIDELCARILLLESEVANLKEKNIAPN